MKIQGVRLQGTKLIPSGVESDTYFNLVTLLLPGTGTNGAQNNTFQDSSTNNFTVTRNGNTTQGTFSPFSQTGWSGYFDGVSDSLTFATSTALSLSGAFTIEFWIFLESLALDTINPSIITFPTQPNAWQVYINSAGSYIGLYDGNADVVNTTSSSITANRWYHVAISRDASNNLAIFLDGVRKGSTASGAGTIGSTTGTIRFMAYDGSQGDVKGYLSNLRIVKGSAVYNPTQTTLTVPTTALTAVSNTQLLICQSNRFVDNSPNAFAITVNGNTSVQAFAPFDPTTAYSADTVGGSGYFDGSGDNLSVADNAAFEFGSGSFTIELWFYLGASGTNALVTKNRSGTSPEGGLGIDVSTTTIRTYIDGNAGTTLVPNISTTISLNTWYHLAVVRSVAGGTNNYVFLNGISVGTSTTSTAFADTSQPLRIATDNLSGSNYNQFTGYISSVRIVKGSAVYTSNFTPPSAPVTAITDTQLLLNFTNGGITDATAKNVLETGGGAAISTAQSKFGGSSMAFDGTGDYVFSPSSINYTLASDFTIEGWAYINASGNYRFFTIGDTVNTTGIEIYVSSGNYVVYSNGSVRITGSTATRQSWTHLAVVRSGSTVTLYINGSASGSTWTTSGTFSGTCYVGAEYYNGSLTSDTNGYIDDFRITKGYARYTANFTPPTQAFPTQ